MRFGVLGPLQVIDGSVPVPVRGRKERALLALLLADHGQAAEADRLIEELWAGAPPPTARRTLQAYVARLRSALGNAGPALRTAGRGYLLEIPPAALDSCRFEHGAAAAAGAARAGRWVEAAGLVSAALAEWRGRPFAQFDDMPTCAAESARLDELRAAAVEDSFDCELALGRSADLIPALETAVTDWPLRERLWGQLMLARYRDGRQAEALDTYLRARSVIKQEAGVEPDGSLRSLHRQILHQDPALQAVMCAPPVNGGTRSGCPFKGLAAYTEADAAVFLGRERASRGRHRRRPARWRHSGQRAGRSRRGRGRGAARGAAPDVDGAGARVGPADR